MITVVNQPLARREPGAVRCRVIAAGVCGSDLPVVRDGEASPDQVLGHEIVAEVLESPSDHPLRPGQRVVVRPSAGCEACWYCRNHLHHLCDSSKELTISYGRPGGYSQILDVADPATCALVAVPDAVSDLDAVWAEPLAVALRAVDRCHSGDPCRAGETDLAVVAAGPLGLCVVAAAREAGYRVHVVEPRKARREAALAAGANTACSPAEAAELGVHRVVVASGAPAAVDLAARLVRPGGTVVLAGLGPAQVPVVPVPCTVVGSFGYTVEQFARAAKLIAEGRVALGSLVSHEVPLEDIASAMELPLREDAVKVVVRP